MPLLAENYKNITNNKTKVEFEYPAIAGTFKLSNSNKFCHETSTPIFLKVK
jgi:hypothetical protein